MHVFTALLAVAFPIAYALPQQVFAPDLSPRYCPVVDSTEDTTGDPWQLGISVKSMGTLMIEEGHEVGTTWTIGGDLGLAVGQVVGVDAGLSGSVSETITDNTAEGAQYQCPEGKWSCSLMVYPAVKLVRGHLEKIEKSRCKVNPTDHDGNYEMKIPRNSEKGNAKSSVQLCTCKNLDGAGDEGHPELMCAEDCVKPA